MTGSAIVEALDAGLEPWLDGDRLKLRGPSRAAPVAQRLREDPRARAELRAALGLAGERLPLCSWFGHVFWRRRDFAGAPWVCATCHPWPGAAAAIETTFRRCIDTTQSTDRVPTWKR